MEVMIDSDVKAVADFMQRTVPTAKLVGVANRLAEIAGLLWGHYSPDDVRALCLAGPITTDHDSQRQSAATG
jgi:hypothetical protein